MAGNVGLALLVNTLATGALLVAIILTFGSVSGAHFNPAVTLADVSQAGLPWRDAPPYILAQTLGAFLGVALADGMFGEPIFAWSRHVRSGTPQLLSECVATFGLLVVIWGTSRRRPASVPYAVAAYITAAYWFTPSTSFANPAVTLARAATDTFAGIRPADVPGFLLAQLLGAAAATILFDGSFLRYLRLRPHCWLTRIRRIDENYNICLCSQRGSITDGSLLFQHAGRAIEGSRHFCGNEPGICSSSCGC